MTNEEIIKGNNLIAEFDGWRLIKYLEPDDTIPFYQKFDNDGECINDGIYHHPTYHNNWNTLMGVVEKIERMDYAVNIDQKWCCITDNGAYPDEDFNIIGMGPINKEGAKIEATWECVVDFITYQNTNQ